MDLRFSQRSFVVDVVLGLNLPEGTCHGETRFLVRRVSSKNLSSISRPSMGLALFGPPWPIGPPNPWADRPIWRKYGSPWSVWD